MSGVSIRFRLCDLLVLTVMGLGVVTVVPVLARVRGLAKRDMCAENLKGIWQSAMIYANENQEKLPIAAFKKSLVNNGGIDYLNNRGWTIGMPVDPGEVGFDRQNESTSETQLDPLGGSTAVSVTRSFWLLVRSGDIRVESFVCPNTYDQPDPELIWENYYDFTSYHNVSYGFQVPFGPRGAQPSDSMDYRQVLAADKGPYYLDRFNPDFMKPRGDAITLEDSPVWWRPYNSPNHQGRGQNCLFADGAVSFQQTPAAGVHGDNIYTLMTDDWDETGFNRIHGESPHYASVPNPYPGQNAFGVGPGLFAATDSLLYP